MNNEEKILEMLTKLTEKVDRLESSQAEMQATQAQQGEQLNKLSADVADLKETVQELDERSLRTAVLLENEIAPKVQLVLDGHSHLVDTLAPKKRVEKVEEVVEQRVVVLESVVKSHSERLAKLEKAQ